MAGAAATAKPVRARPPAPRRPLRGVAPPRRVSGSARGRARPAGGASPRGLPGAAVATLGRISNHPLLERLIRGRWSIALVAFALIGIVTLQLGLLQLNRGIGHTLLRERTLERENASLSVENATLASDERIQQLAVQLGMQPAGLTALRFLPARHGSGLSAAAAAALRAPAQHPEGEAASSSAATAGGASEGTATTSTTGASGAQGGEAAGAPETQAGASVPETQASTPTPETQSSAPAGETQSSASAGGAEGSGTAEQQGGATGGGEAGGG